MIDDFIFPHCLEHDIKRRKEKGREKEWKFVPLVEKRTPCV
jgi:hypothetical protein